MMSWAQAMAVDRAMKPVQSKRLRVRSVWPASTNQMQTEAVTPGGTIMKNAQRQS